MAPVGNGCQPKGDRHRLGFDSVDFETPDVLTGFESGGRDQTSSFSREIWKRCYSLGRGRLRTAGNSDMAQSCKCRTSL